VTAAANRLDQYAGPGMAKMAKLAEISAG
jgi:hypothetical protein